MLICLLLCPGQVSNQVYTILVQYASHIFLHHPQLALLHIHRNFNKAGKHLRERWSRVVTFI